MKQIYRLGTSKIRSPLGWEYNFNEHRSCGLRAHLPGAPSTQGRPVPQPTKSLPHPAPTHPKTAWPSNFNGSWPNLAKPTHNRGLDCVRNLRAPISQALRRLGWSKSRSTISPQLQLYILAMPRVGFSGRTYSMHEARYEAWTVAETLTLHYSKRPLIRRPEITLGKPWAATLSRYVLKYINI